MQMEHYASLMWAIMLVGATSAREKSWRVFFGLFSFVWFFLSIIERLL